MIRNYKFEDIDKKGLSLQTQKRSVTDSTINKELYGEVFTPFSLINKMFDIIPVKIFEDPSLKWLDPGAGTGNFSIILYFKLLEHLKEKIPDIEERKNHIIKKMIYMVELRCENTEILKNLFGSDANIYEENFLNYESEVFFDVIIGNPPFNNIGLKKVPTITIP